MRPHSSLLAAVAVLAIGGVLSVLLADYQLRLLNISVISAIAVIGFNFAFGLAGLISLGHAAFVGMGAYTLAIVTTTLGLSPWAAIPLAITLTTVFAGLIGYPLLRLRGHYLALATLGLNVSFTIVLTNWVGLTGGTNGISNIPDLRIAGFAFHDERRFLWLAMVFLAACTAAAVTLQRSSLGRAMMAVRDDEIAAEMTGIDVTRIKIIALCLSAAFAALAGALFATHVRFVAPEDFSYAHSIVYLAMLIVGGEGTVIGAIIGATLLTFLPEWLRFLGTAYLAFFGLMLLVILIFLPTGLVGLISRLRRGKRASKWGSMP
ncbi:branched-chain amino acid ABC transporter permease [Bosea sp. (in: a-proteobacteria)]|jgi:branched-chain amino acid transport system permease protein|uniref:branched-chain amino acid ABC transporter permease n=1 Tax=Bosea sp. (in: a-proteobacteria) TaxID=1871050 RepID=UPI002DDD900A|nr:branched-chain amino acid ABC transporter permease [Bosea sp. (in: a-proteobacteria)]HEV2510283.1 branched-chain amino acid ABC transporter permease [Bosea sp. (in: a-proteobacteria)]